MHSARFRPVQRLSYEECRQQAREAWKKAYAAKSAQECETYAAIGELWNALSESLIRNGLTEIPRL